MPTKSEIRFSLAKAIKDAIEIHEQNIAKNNAKEAAGLDKLTKNGANQVDPALSGAGTEISAGAPMTDVPNTMKAEVACSGSKVEKGALPMDGGMDKAEEDFDNDQAQPCLACNGPLMELGTLGNMVHSVCRNCGMPHTHPREENQEAIANAPAEGMMKGSLETANKAKEAPLRQKVSQTEGWMSQAYKLPFGRTQSSMLVHAGTALDTARGELKTVSDRNKRAEYEASKVEKAEIPPVQSAPEKSLPGTKEPPEKGGKAIEAEGSGGDVSKAKTLTKGAIETMVRQAKARAGIPAHQDVPVKGFPHIPAKTNQVAPPPKSPDFYNNGRVGWAKAELGGVAREMAIKTGKPLIPGRGLVPKLAGGVQREMAIKNAAANAPKAALVNQGGPVAKAEKTSDKKPGLSKKAPSDVSEKTVMKLKDEYGHDKKGTQKAMKVAWSIHNKKVEKAEPGAAIAKSPMSKPAATVAPKAPAASQPKVSKL